MIGTMRQYSVSMIVNSSSRAHSVIRTLSQSSNTTNRTPFQFGSRQSVVVSICRRFS